MLDCSPFPYMFFFFNFVQAGEYRLYTVHNTSLKNKGFVVLKSHCNYNVHCINYSIRIEADSLHTHIHTNFIQDVNKLIYRKNIILKDILKRKLKG